MRNKRETAFQTQVIEHATRLGGDGGKWSSEFKLNVPDLILTFPHMGLVLAEMKVERFVKTGPVLGMFPPFDRKLKLTLGQKEKCQKLYKGGARICTIVVLDLGDSRHRKLVAVPPWVHRLSSQWLDDGLFPVIDIPHGGTMDLYYLFEQIQSVIEHCEVSNVTDPQSCFYIPDEYTKNTGEVKQ